MEEPALPQPRPWGYWATLAWALLAAVASIVGAVSILVIVFPERFSPRGELDVRVAGITSLAAIAAEFAVFALAARIAHWRVGNYLGLILPSWREAAFGLASVSALVIGLDGITYLLGRDVVTQFQIDLYRSTSSAGALAVLLFAVIVAAPVGEELMFRGFLFRGWIQKPGDLTFAVVIISAIWAALHTQYDWYGMIYIFLLGLLLGLVRWRSGSTLLTMGMHALVNAWATAQTFIVIKWMA
jgi:CAAX protease family protein